MKPNFYSSNKEYNITQVNQLFSKFIDCYYGMYISPRDEKGHADKKPLISAGQTREHLVANGVTCYTTAIHNYSWHSFCGLLNKDYYLVDIDNMAMAEKAFGIVKDMNIQTVVIKTFRGYHFIFKTGDVEYSAVSDVITTSGLHVDYKHGRKLCWEALKENGQFREVLWMPDEGKDIDTLPLWLEPLNHNKARMYNPDKDDDIFGIREGGRNSALWSWLCKLMSNGRTHEEVKYLANIINENILAERLDVEEMSNMLSEDHLSSFRVYTSGHTYTRVPSDNRIAFEQQIEGKPYLYQRANGTYRVDAQAFADVFFATYTPKLFHNSVYYYNEKSGLYETDGYSVQDSISGHACRIDSETAGNKKVVEVIKSYLHDTERFPIITEELPWNWVAFSNCIVEIDLDNYSLKTHDFSPKYFIRNKLNAKYLGSNFRLLSRAESFINSVSSGDKGQVELLYEIIGTCMVRKAFGKMFFLIGDGRNGKSTYTKIIENIVGTSNISHCGPDMITAKFGTSFIENKLAVISTDINSTFNDNSAILKALVFGEPISVENKGQKAYEAVTYCSYVWACNNMPMFRDSSNGLKRRTVVVPFDQDYTGREDVTLGDYLARPEVNDYFANRAFLALVELMKRKLVFSTSDVIDNETESYVESFRDSIAEFCCDNDYTTEFLVGKNSSDVYQRYLEFCERNHYNASNRTTFGLRMKELMKVKSVRKMVGGVKGYFYESLSQDFNRAMHQVNVNIEPELEVTETVVVNNEDKLDESYDPLSEEVPDGLDFGSIDEYLDESAAREETDDGLVGYNDGYADGVM